MNNSQKDPNILPARAIFLQRVVGQFPKSPKWVGGKTPILPI